jgi:hypothetical protein
MDETPRLKCRLRIGESEIEIEGSGSIDSAINEKIVELIDTFEETLSSSGPIAGQEIREEELSAGNAKPEDTDKSDRKKDARGGTRQPFISKNLKELGAKGQLVNITAAEVNAILKEKYGLHVKEGSVYAALRRGLGKSMTRTGTTPQDSRFTYIKGVEKPVDSGSAEE